MNTILIKQFNVIDYLQNFSHLALFHHQLVLGNHHAYTMKFPTLFKPLLLKNNKSQLWQHEQFSQIAQDLQQHHNLLTCLKEQNDIIVNQLGPLIQQTIKNSQNPLVTRITTNTSTIHGLQTQVNELRDQLDSQSTGYKPPPLPTGNSSNISACPPSCPCSQLTHK